MTIFGGSTLLGGGSFAEAESEAHRFVQAEFAEPWRHRPMMSAGPNAQQVVDPSRPVSDIKAIFEWEAKDINLRNDHVAVSSRTPKLTIHNCTLTRIRRRDVFERCADGAQFEARTVHRDGLSGIEVELVELGVQG